MKLPSGISDYETPFNMVFAESVVRHCAKVCREKAELYKSNSAAKYSETIERMLIAEGAAHSCEETILREFELDVK